MHIKFENRLCIPCPIMIAWPVGPYTSKLMIFKNDWKSQYSNYQPSKQQTFVNIKNFSCLVQFVWFVLTVAKL